MSERSLICIVELLTKIKKRRATMLGIGMKAGKRGSFPYEECSNPVVCNKYRGDVTLSVDFIEIMCFLFTVIYLVFL